jgi:regulator of RNase E activity RraA
MNISDQIIQKIKINRISTTEIADCMDKTGSLPDIQPVNSKKHVVGKIFWAYALNESNWELHEQIIDVQKDDIVLVEPFNCNDRAIFGDLVSKFLILYKQCSGIVVNGKLRDVHALIKENWPIWYKGPNPIGCTNLKNNNPLAPEVILKNKDVYNGSIAVCDDTGVVVIPKAFHNKDFLLKLDWIEEQEDIWFECIDKLKWSTYETVCLKKYLKNN